ncbi:hypothetical protein Tco_0529627 [Tanacetum coccineum]
MIIDQLVSLSLPVLLHKASNKLHGVTNNLDTPIVDACLRIAFVFEDRGDVTESPLFRHLRASEGLVKEASQPGNPHFYMVDPRVAVRIWQQSEYGTMLGSLTSSHPSGSPVLKREEKYSPQLLLISSSSVMVRPPSSFITYCTSSQSHQDSLRVIWVFDVPIATPRVSFAASLMILARMFHIVFASLADMTSALVETPFATLDLNTEVELDRNLLYVPAVVSENGDEVVIFKEELVHEGSNN